jgi:hypothetical protein
MQKKGGMNFATKAAIAKCLHPEHEPTDAEKDHACKLFTQFTSDARKADRR